MTLPTWVAAGTEAAGTGDITPGLPTGWAENDIFLLLVETAQEFVAEPTDYDVVADSPQGGGVAAGTNSTRLDMFWKRATSSESAPTITDPGNHAIAQIHAFRGCVTTGDPWDVTSGLFTGTAATAHSIPGDTTTVDDCLVVLAGSSATDATTPRFSAWANADLVNINERGDVSTDVGNGGGLGLATGEKATAGAYGTTSFTLATSSFSGKMTVALKPATAGATNLVIQDATHVHSAESQSFTQVHNLTVAEASHGHAADQQALTQVHELAVAGTGHDHSADNVVLEPAGELAIASATHAHTIDEVSLTQTYELQVQDANHGHSADGLVLTQVHVLVVADAAHAHSADNLLVTLPAIALVISDGAHTLTSDGLVLAQAHYLVVVDAHHELTDNYPFLAEQRRVRSRAGVRMPRRQRSRFDPGRDTGR